MNTNPRTAQADAHEGIRPTRVHPLSACASVVGKESLSGDHVKLYELIAKRTMASQMAQAVFDTTSALLECASETFKANGRVMLFDGFRKLWAAEEENSDAPAKDRSTDSNQKMPDVQPKDVLDKVKDRLEEKTTK